MVLNAKPKKFGPVYAASGDSDAITYAYRDPARSSPHPPVQSPVETMLAALAACIVKSLRWSAGQHDTAVRPFTVQVDGLKAMDDPSRVETITITVIGQFVEDTTKADVILAQAKSVCTVSNTLNAEITLLAVGSPDG